MSNPAALLLDQLTTWRTSASYVSPNEQRVAVRHLDAIEELLNQMDGAGLKTSLYWKYFGRWGELVCRHPHGWHKDQAKAHFDDTALEHLEHLDDRLKGLVPELQSGGLDSLREYAAEARDIVDGDSTIDPDLRMHVKQVIAHLNWCIENYDAVGDFHLQAAVDRLFATMVRATGASQDRPRWIAWLNKVVWPFGKKAAAEIGVGVVTQLMLGGS
ncbi:hypothetical protein [Mycobacteroides abscessus]|uniref:hypothetical protein n=1 Tax=Mycobacteroides abscessus TaxID=36809 RepID=UPI001878ECFD|nr:hypothetical protein [Mycobacteroides abscessus]